MRSVTVVALATFLLFSHPLMAADMIPATPVAAPRYVAPAPPPPAPIFYIGGGGNIVHHTGYVPGTESATEKWVFGGKAFGGVKVFEWAKVEVAYFYLSGASFLVEPVIPSYERSHAAAATVIVCCVWLHQLVNSPFKTGIFGRVGGAYKWIHYRSSTGSTFDEGGVSYVLGFGAEVDVTSWAFFRVEYEYISKVIGGTKNAVDVQHTPISLSLGFRF